MWKIERKRPRQHRTVPQSGIDENRMEKKKKERSKKQHTTHCLVVSGWKLKRYAHDCLISLKPSCFWFPSLVARCYFSCLHRFSSCAALTHRNRPQVSFDKNKINKRNIHETKQLYRRSIYYYFLFFIVLFYIRSIIRVWFSLTYCRVQTLKLMWTNYKPKNKVRRRQRRRRNK